MPETVIQPAEPALEARILGLLMPAFAVMSVALVVYGVSRSHAWPLAHDAPLMHYVVFLMRHGMAPYRDIIEMNLPGAYMMQGAVMRTLGESAQAWWMFDTLMGAAAIAGGAWVAGRGHRAAGVAGAAFAYLFHLGGGPFDMGQRDWAVALGSVLSLGAGLSALRSRNPRWMALFGLLAVGAALIKPPILLCDVVFLGILLWQARRRGLALGPLLLWVLPGAAVPLLATLIFLLRWHAVGAFVWTMTSLVPYYAGLQKVSVSVMLNSMHIGRSVPVVLLLGLWLWRRRPETPYLYAGAAMGTLLFLSQRKGWHYHLYVEMLFLYLAVFFVLSMGLRERNRWVRWASVVLLLSMTVRLKATMSGIVHQGYDMGTLNSLRADLAAMGGSALNGRVQCLDMTNGGCINALYQSHLVQSTGFIYDYYLLAAPKTPMPAPVTKLQGQFLADVTGRPPEVFVLSSQIWPGSGYGYSHLDNWPAFRDWLNGHYTLVVQRDWSDGAAGYRIYRWKGGA